MRNVTKSKSEYKQRWHDYIMQLRVLEFNGDIDLQRRIHKLIDELLVCVDKVAEVKDLPEK